MKLPKRQIVPNPPLPKQPIHTESRTTIATAQKAADHENHDMNEAMMVSSDSPNVIALYFFVLLLSSFQTQSTYFHNILIAGCHRR